MPAFGNPAGSNSGGGRGERGVDRIGPARRAPRLMNDQANYCCALTGLARRNMQPEIMDQPDLDRARHLAALVGLAHVNWVSRSAGNVWGPIRSLARRDERQPLRLLDLASGGGDVSIGLARRARRHGLELEIVGYDLSPTAVEHARARAAELGIARTVRGATFSASRGTVHSTWSCARFFCTISTSSMPPIC